MDISYSGIMAALVFGIWGMYFIRQAKKEGNLKQLVVGVVLLIYPYFISDAYLLWGLGVGLTAMGFWL